MKKTPEQLAREMAEIMRRAYPLGMDEVDEIFHEQVRRATIDVENFGQSIARIAIAAALRIAMRSYFRTTPRWLIPAHLFERFALAVWRTLY